MFRALAVIAVRQDDCQTAQTTPFGFTGRDELVNRHLCAVGKIAELSFPNGQHIRSRAGMAVFISQHGLFIQNGIDNGKRCLAVADVLQRNINAGIPFFTVLVMQYSLTM